MPESKDQIARIEQNSSGSHPQVSGSGKYVYWIVALAVLLLCILYHRMPGSLGFPLDDGYISLHSAQVLHWGKDPNFPDVAPLAGITNAPYVLLLYLLLFVFSPLNALLTASWLGILCYAMGLTALGRAFRLPPLTALALAALGLTSGSVSYHLLNGVETGMAMGVTCWTFALAKSNTVRSRKGAVLLCGLAPFLRPELVVVSPLVLAAMFWQDCQEGKSIQQAAQRPVPLVLLAGLAALPWLLWYRLTTGTMIPQSIEAKRLYFAEGCLPSVYRWHMALNGTRLFIGVMGFLSLALVFLVRNRLGRCVLLFIPLFFLAYYERLPGALFHNWGRYTYALLPVLILGLVSGLGDQSTPVRRMAYAVLALSCVQSAFSFPGHWRHFLHDRDGYTQSLMSVAAWSNNHLPANATLLVHDVGYISYATKFHIIDFVGLKTPSSIVYNRDFTYGTCGIGRAVAVSEIARHTKPDYLIMVDDWDRGFRITAGLRQLGWRVEEIAPPENYHVFRLAPPTAPLQTGLIVR